MIDLLLTLFQLFIFANIISLIVLATIIIAYIVYEITINF